MGCVVFQVVQLWRQYESMRDKVTGMVGGYSACMDDVSKLEVPSVAAGTSISELCRRRVYLSLPSAKYGIQRGWRLKDGNAHKWKRRVPPIESDVAVKAWMWWR